MTDHAPAAGHDANPDQVAHHDSATHMDVHASIGDDDHGHAEPRVGPIDWRAWFYAAVGFAAGLVVVAFLWVKTIGA